MKPLILAAVAWCAAAGACLAENPPPPAQPVLRRAPAFSSWTIQFKYKVDEKGPKSAKQSAPQPGPEAVATLIVTKTNTSYREQSTLRSGAKGEKWIVDGVVLNLAPGSSTVVPVPAPTDESPSPDFADFRRSDFLRFEWVSLDTYIGVKPYKGKPAYAFEKVASDGRKLIAFLSVDTQLPLFCSDWETTRIYTYNPSPTAPLVLPDAFLSVLKAQEKGMERSSFHASPP